MNLLAVCRRTALSAVCACLCMHAAAQTDDAALLRELRELRTGVAVLMRHAQTTPGVGDPSGWRPEQCSSQRNLDASGVAHAKRIGEWFQSQRLRVSAVRNSPWCRTRDTAKLAFARHDDWPALSNLFEDRSRADVQAAAVTRYVESLKPGELVVLVSHGSTIGHIVPGGGGLASGEAVVVRRGATAGAPPTVIGRLMVP
jgi:phosphohistidine phosphatase SixA